MSKGEHDPMAEASKEARRRASLVLEVLSGIRTTVEAAEAIGVTLARYYTLEKAAIDGLVAALEPRSAGGPRGPRAETQIARLTEERDRLRRELQSAQALARVAQRAFGLPSVEAQRKAQNKRRKAQGKKRAKKPEVRARRAVARLKPKEEGQKPAPAKQSEPEKRRA